MTHLAFHPSKPLFAFCTSKPPKGWPGTAWFGDLETGEPVAVPDPGFKAASRVAFAPDGLTCAVGSTNREFAVFDLDG